MIAGHPDMTIYQNSKHLNVVSTQKNGDHGTRIKLECRPILMLDSHVVVDTDYLLAVRHSTICLVPFWVTQVSQISTRQMVLCRTARRQSVFTSKCESSIKLDLDCLLEVCRLWLVWREVSWPPHTRVSFSKIQRGSLIHVNRLHYFISCDGNRAKNWYWSLKIWWMVISRWPSVLKIISSLFCTLTWSLCRLWHRFYSEYCQSQFKSVCWTVQYNWVSLWIRAFCCLVVGCLQWDLHCGCSTATLITGKFVICKFVNL